MYVLCHRGKYGGAWGSVLAASRPGGEKFDVCLSRFIA